MSKETTEPKVKKPRKKKDNTPPEVVAKDSSPTETTESPTETTPPPAPTPKVEEKIVYIGSYNVVVEIEKLDPRLHSPSTKMIFDSVTVEGKSPEDTFEKFLRWYLIYRSSYFPGLVFENVEDIINDSDSLSFDREKEPLMLGKFKAEIPCKDGTKIIRAYLFKRFII